MAGRSLGRTISDNEINTLLELLKHLPIQDCVQEGLSILHDKGFRIAALTNIPQKTVIDRMERTGLVSYFESVLSAEHVKKYKPCVEVYEWAASKLKVAIGEILLVSSHGWDIAGGANAGMQTAYIKQDKQMLYPLAPAPTFTCDNLVDLANQLEIKNAIEQKDTN
jgi:2-haloacid dehalogenase